MSSRPRCRCSFPCRLAWRERKRRRMARLPRSSSERLAKKTEKELNIKQLSYRLHVNDKILFKKVLRDEEIGFQSFVDACMHAFLRGDPNIMKVIDDWKQLSTVPRDHVELYTLSHRERVELQKELDRIRTEFDENPNQQRGEDAEMQRGEQRGELQKGEEEDGIAG